MNLSFAPSPDPPFNLRVVPIQIALLLPASQVDGRFGPKTEEAVSSFQHAVNLPDTGVVDQTTAKSSDFLSEYVSYLKS